MKRQYRVTNLAAILLSLVLQPAFPQAEADYDLRDITVGMSVAEIPNPGYVNLTCANNTDRKLQAWSAWRECPLDADATHAIRFDFDPNTSREGTRVAGHPVVLTALIDDNGTVSGLKIDTDPNARMYMKKKAFLFGVQVKSRYGSEGWVCTQRQPENGEQPVGGTYVNESCRKTVQGRILVVERDLFRRPDQDSKNFVDQTRVKITREVK
jgi:hypothetical protein